MKQKSSSKLILGILALAACVTGAFVYRNQIHSSPKSLVFQLNDPPASFDPIDFDHFVHHVIQRPVFLTLTTLYLSSNVRPSLAEDWKSTNQDTKWTFKIRKGLTFSDSSSLGSREIATSFSRIAYLLNRKGSKDGLLEHLIGVKQQASASELPSGISFTAEELILEFSLPIPRAPELLAFGVYAIASSKNWEKSTGVWESERSKSPIGSGPYQVLEMSSDHILVGRRERILDGLARPDSPPKVRFIWGQQSSMLMPDIAMADSDEESIPGYTFFGPSRTNFSYLRFASATRPKSVFRSKEVREALAAAIRAELALQGIQTERSFLPEAVLGIDSSLPTALADNALLAPSPTPILSGQNIKMKRPVGYRSKVALSLLESVRRAVERLGGTFEESQPSPKPSVLNELQSLGYSNSTDLVLMGSGVLLEHPRDDIRYMFRSKEGIALSDIDGSISKSIEDPNFDISAVNRLLLAQCVQIPVSHYASGLFVSSGVDMSAINLAQPPTDLSWIGWNP